MTITSALAFGARSVARLSWPVAKVFIDSDGLWYRRYPLTFGCEWKPTLADLVAEDWIAFDEYPR